MGEDSRDCSSQVLTDLNNVTFEKLLTLLPFFRSGKDYLAFTPLSRIVVYQFDKEWHYRMISYGATPEDSSEVTGSNPDRDTLAQLLWQAVLEQRTAILEARTGEVLPILQTFIEGPLRAYLEGGCSHSRFLEITNESFGTSIRKSDLFPGWLFKDQAHPSE
jgi:hypothetical protein